MASFKQPIIHDNPDGWGPPMDLAPAKFQDMPYAPFSKSDRLGRAADWTSFGGRGGREAPADDQSSEFTMVDNKVLPRPSGFTRGRGGFRGQFRGRGGRMNDRGMMDRDGTRRSGRNAARPSSRGGGRAPFRSRWEDRRNIQRESSVEVRPDWELLEELPAVVLNKLPQLTNIDGKDITFCGALPFFDRTLDRVTVKAPRRLRVSDVEYPRITTTDDPVIRRIAGSGEGTIFATSAILALIMVAPRAVQSWDVIVQRIGDKIFLDKRDGSMADFITVNETSHDPPKDEKNMNGDEAVNSFQRLAAEATAINENFVQQVVSSSDVYRYKEPSPFDDEVEGTPAVVAYRYRKWDLGDGMVVVARCELDGAYKPTGDEEPEPISIRALNEYFDPNARRSTDWRGKLDTQRAAVLATEVKNNAAKLARWTAEAVMAESARIKFGFVSRVKGGDNENHVILGSQMYRPRDFASQIALNTNKMWGILKGIMDLCYKKLADGDKGVILKDPNKSIIRLYRVPDDAFESNDEEEEENESHSQMGLFS